MKCPQTKLDLVPHMNIESETRAEVAMENMVRYDPRTYPAGCTVIFEFPPKTENDELVRLEVKAILEGAMKEHLHKTS